jgi:DNA-directed RNA polymerase, beta'' subunit/160 kD subunit
MFDGDEMNVFVCQGIQTQVELEEIADVKRQIISPKDSRTVIGIVQDGLLGAYNLTSPNMRIDWRNSMNIMSYTSLDDLTSFKKNQAYSGHELFSMIIPPNININRGTGDKQLIVKNGVLEKGYLSKELLGHGNKNNLTQLIWDEYGVEETRKFLDNAQRLLNNFNLYNGFTAGIGDASISRDLEIQIEKMLATLELKVEHMITEYENNPDLLSNEQIESKLFREYNGVRDDVAKLILHNLPANNNFTIMMNAGANKGNITKIGQIQGCIGMQAFEGDMMPKKLNDRTTPYFFKDDDRPSSRGLVKRSYARGVTFPEFFFLCMTGREGSIDQAIKTAESGYIQRRLVKSLEDVIIHYDGTVRTSNNSVIQFIYGDSGAEPTKQYEFTMKLMEQGNDQIEFQHKFTKQELSNYDYTEKENEEYYNMLINMRDELRISQIKTRLDFMIMSTKFMLPVNLQRLLDNTKNMITNEKNNKDKLNPRYIVENLKNILNNNKTTLVTMKTYDRDNEQSLKYIDDKIAKRAFSIALHDVLSPKRCLIEYKFNKQHFDTIINEITSNFNKNMAEPGENVGVVAAQSLGEPSSQLSCIKSTHVRISESFNSNNYSGTIGNFVDDLMNKYRSLVIDLGNESFVLDTTNIPENYKIIATSINGYTSWKRITEVSRHPANGKLVKVTTKSGRITTATLSHSFLRKSHKGIVPIKGSELELGMCIPVAKYIPTINNPITYIKIDDVEIELNEKFGYFCGYVLTNLKYKKNNIIPDNFNSLANSLCNNLEIVDDRHREKIIFFLLKYFNLEKKNKYMHGLIFSSNIDFIKGIISAMFVFLFKQKISNDFHIQSKKISNFIDDYSILLTYFGIFTNKKHSCLLIPIEYFDKLDTLIHQKKYDSMKKNIKREKYIDNEIIPETSHLYHKLNDLLKKSEQIENKEYNSITRTNIKNIVNYSKNYLKTISDINNEIICEINQITRDLEEIYNSNIYWDPIEKLEYLNTDDYVYDFTVATNDETMVDSFMVDSGIIVHNTLNSIHNAGIVSISATLSGVPRIKEILGLTQLIKTPQMVIYLTKDFMNNLTMTNRISSYIKFTTLGNIRKRLVVYYDPNPKAENGFMNRDKVNKIYTPHNVTKNSCQTDINILPWLIKIEFDKETLFDKDITLTEIKNKFCLMWEKRYVEKTIKKEERVIFDRIKQIAILTSDDNAKVPILHIRFDISEFDMTILNNFIDFIDRFKLKGLPSIENTVPPKLENVIVLDNPNGNLETSKQYVIYTVGINLYDIRYLNGIDIYRTICNDIITMYETFGVEAARATLLRELAFAYEKAGSIIINYQHLSVLVDLMTFNGYLMSIDRHGMGKSDYGPLSRASFEKPVDQLLSAATFSEVDNMRSVSARIMAGLVVKAGTGLCDILLNTEMVQNSEFTENDISQKYVKTYNEITVNSFMTDIMNNPPSTVFVPHE